MHRADKAVLRLAIGLASSVLVAYGFAIQVPFVACVLAVLVLVKPGPPLPFMKGVIASAVVAAVLVAGVLLVPVLEHYRAAGLLLAATLLFAVFFAGARRASPVTSILAIAFAFIPVAGVAEQALAIALAQAIGVGLAIGFLVSRISHALFPDAPAQAHATAPAGVAPHAARMIALRATLVVMPVMALALTNPTSYLMAVMKTVMMGQQASATTAQSAGRELVGSTAVGAVMAMLAWTGLTLRPNLWMLALWVAAAALWAGVRIYRVKPTRAPPSFWVNALVTMLILLGPAIEDSTNGKDVYLASAIRVSVFLGVAFYAWALVWVLERWQASRPAPGSLQHG